MSLKSEVAAIAPELAYLIYGRPQKDRVLIQSLEDNTLTIDDVEYIYEVQLEDTIEDIIDGLIALVEGAEVPQVTVVNRQAGYFDIRGVTNDVFNTTTPSASYTLETAVPEILWDLLEEDAESIINETTFKAEIQRARRYFMAHMLTSHRLGNIDSGMISQSVGQVSVTYANPREEFSKTAYGSIYFRIYLDNRRMKIV